MIGNSKKIKSNKKNMNMQRRPECKDTTNITGNNSVVLFPLCSFTCSSMKEMFSMLQAPFEKKKNQKV